MGEEGHHARRQAVVVQRPDNPRVELHLDAAPGPTAPSVLADQNLVAVDAELAYLERLLLEGVWFHPCPHRGGAFQRLLTSRRNKLSLGMGNLYRGVEVAATERLVSAAQALDDLLISVGHRPRSISRPAEVAAFAAQAPGAALWTSLSRASRRLPIPSARRAGDSWPSRNAPCSVKTNRVPLSPTGVNSTVASETEILVSCKSMS